MGEERDPKGMFRITFTTTNWRGHEEFTLLNDESKQKDRWTTTIAIFVQSADGVYTNFHSHSLSINLTTEVTSRMEIYAET